MKILVQTCPFTTSIRLCPTHVGVGLLLKYNPTFLLLLFAMCLRPTHWVSVVVNPFYASTKHVDCWCVKVGLKLTSNRTLHFIIFESREKTHPYVHQCVTRPCGGL